MSEWRLKRLTIAILPLVASAILFVFSDFVPRGGDGSLMECFIILGSLWLASGWLQMGDGIAYLSRVANQIASKDNPANTENTTKKVSPSIGSNETGNN